MPGKEVVAIAHLLLEPHCIAWKTGQEDVGRLIPMAF